MTDRLLMFLCASLRDKEMKEDEALVMLRKISHAIDIAYLVDEKANQACDYLIKFFEKDIVTLGCQKDEVIKLIKKNEKTNTNSAGVNR